MTIISDVQRYASKEALYIAVRNAENRVVDDDMLRKLPHTATDYTHHYEWEIRAKSLQHFMRKINNLRKPLKILDVGCGNGWMSAALFNAGHTVTAVDLNLTELQQAEKVFGTHERLQWVYANLLEDEIINAPFDIVVFGASCQYFPDIVTLTEKVKSLLSETGNIHLLDSFFYADNEIFAAHQRTKEYYTRLGFPEMVAYYAHHKINDLKKLGYKKKFPRFFWQKNHPQWWIL